MFGTGIPLPAQFLPDGDPDLTQWKKWIRSLKNFLVASGLTKPNDDEEDKRKKAILLHMAGSKINDIFETLAKTDDSDTFEETIGKINKYLQPKQNVSFERYTFRQLSQESDENMQAYIIKLKKAAESCDFDHYSEDQALVDQILTNCKSTKLRKKLLAEGAGKTLTTTEIIALASIQESTEKQMEKMTGEAAPKDEELNSTKTANTFPEGHNSNDDAETNWQRTTTYNRNKQYNRGNRRSNPPNSRYNSYRRNNYGNTGNGPCFYCGGEIHKSISDCPARGKTCNICKKLNHFSSVCRSKYNAQQSNATYEDGESNDTEDDQFTFTCNETKPPRTTQADHTYVTIKIEGQSIQMIADSGSTVNIIDNNTYLQLNSKINLPLQNSKTRIFPYGSTEPLPLKGFFNARVTYKESSCITKFFVINNSTSGCLLSKSSLIELNILTFNGDLEQQNLTGKINNITNNKSRYEELLRRFPEITQGVGSLKDTELHLHIDRNVEPVIQPTRRMPFHLRPKVERKIKQLLSEDIIEPVSNHTTWLSPIQIVPSGNNDIRMVVDMRQANKAIKRTRRHIPMLEDVLYQLNGATMFSKLDLRMGYHQIPLDKDSRDITTFTTHCGTYRYKRLLFGINSAFEDFQFLISSALSDCKGCKNISDDIVIFGKTEKEHNENLEAVLQKLQDCGLTINPEKCQFGLEEVTYFGYRINKDGISPTDVRCEAIKQLPRPTNPTEVRSLLGMTNMLARFIPCYCDIIAPLTNLTKAKVKWSWTKKEEDAFLNLKAEITSDRTLSHFDPSIESEMYTDASPTGISAILVQNGHPIIYVSRLLSDVETRYCHTEKEALAIVWGCERLHMYLYGSRFTLHTDHMPLLTLYSTKGKPSSRILRWALRLQQYDFKIKYIKGQDNPSDYLSRHSSTPPDDKTKEEYINFVIGNTIPKSVSLQETVVESLNDEELQSIIQAVTTNNWQKFKGNRAYYHLRNELTHKNGLILKDNQIIIPTSLRTRVIKLAHEGHMGKTKTKQLLRSKVWWPGIDRAVDNLISQCIPCQSTTWEGKESVTPLKPTPAPSTPFTCIHVDLCGPFPTGESVFSSIDETSRWPTVTILKSTVTSKITSVLDDLSSTFGYPDCIRSDNGPQFISKEFKDYCIKQGIDHKPVTPYYPQANGEVERFFRTLKKVICCAINEGKPWKNEILKFLLNYRNTPHQTTGKSPAEIVLNYEPRTRLPSTRKLSNPTAEQKMKELLAKDAESKQKMKTYADNYNKAKESVVTKGDYILLRRQRRYNKFHSPYDPEPYLVIDRKGNKVVLQKGNKIFHRNVSQIKILRNFTSPQQQPLRSKPTPAPKPKRPAENTYYYGPTITISPGQNSPKSTLAEPVTTRNSTEGGVTVPNIPPITTQTSLTIESPLKTQSSVTEIISPAQISCNDSPQTPGGSTTHTVPIEPETGMEHASYDNPIEAETGIEHASYDSSSGIGPGNITPANTMDVSSKRTPVVILTDTNPEKEFDVEIWKRCGTRQQPHRQVKRKEEKSDVV